MRNVTARWRDVAIAIAVITACNVVIAFWMDHHAELGHLTSERRAKLFEDMMLGPFSHWFHRHDLGLSAALLVIAAATQMPLTMTVVHAVVRSRFGLAAFGGMWLFGSYILNIAIWI